MWIVLSIYLIIGSLIASYAYSLLVGVCEKKRCSLSVGAGVLWPLIFVCFIVGFILVLIDEYICSLCDEQEDLGDNEEYDD